MNKKMMKAISGVMGIGMLLTSVSATANAATAGESVSMDSITKIDFSKEPTEEEKKLMMQYYAEDTEKIFSEDVADELYEKDTQEINSLTETEKEKLYPKEAVGNSSRKNVEPVGENESSIGTFGDILVSYTFSSFGFDIGVPGHAGIVHTNEARTIESFPEGNGYANGVRRYTNDWKKRGHSYGVRVKGATKADYTAAAKYAIAQIGKPYNWNYFNKGTTDSFYCSQLVWRAWKNQGFDIDRMNLGDWEPVSPAELVGGSNTYVFYKD